MYSPFFSLILLKDILVSAVFCDYEKPFVISHVGFCVDISFQISWVNIYRSEIAGPYEIMYSL